jgi:ABC-type uncharacterized transport system involved in gliding motility auxiliary subunit
MEIMKAFMKKYSNIIAIIGLVALLAAGVIALIMKSFSIPVEISLIVAVIFLGAYGIFNPEKILSFFQGRQAKHGANSLVMTLSVLVIIVVVNIIGYKNTVRWDLTADKTNSLTKETLSTLKSLKEDVYAQAFFSSNTSSTDAKTLLLNFKSSSNGKFDYKFIDPNQEPAAANAAGITRDGTIVLTMGSSKEIITSVTENDITSAIIRLQSPEDKIIYTLVGEGEPSFTTNAATSFYYANQELKSKNYTIKDLNLISESKVPEDAKAVIIAGPQKPLSENEVSILKDYVDKGGSLLIMYEPTVMTQFGDSPDPLSTYLDSTWGMTLENDFVVDMTANASSTAVVTKYGSHEITKNLTNMASILPSARTIKVDTTKKDLTLTELAYTSSQSWAEFDLASLKDNKVKFDTGTDQQGPLVVAASGLNPTTKARIVVFGDSDFVTDSYYQYYSNADLFINAVDWVSNQDALITLTSREQTTRLLVTPSGYGLSAILLGTVVLIPAAIILAAIIVFVRRRREV